MKDIFQGTVHWIKHDWNSNRFRFFVEFVAWAISVGCALTMALTVPNPPVLDYYPCDYLLFYYCKYYPTLVT